MLMKTLFVAALAAFCFGAAQAANPAECSECQVVVAFVENELANNATEAEIAKVVAAVCKSLGEPSVVCATIALEIPEIVAKIEAAQNATTICAELKFCSTFGRALRRHGRLPQLRGPTDYCSECQLFVGFIEQYLADNSTQSVIEKEVAAICKAIGQSASTCTLIETEIPTIINLLEQKQNSTVICKEINLCPSRGFLNPAAFAGGRLLRDFNSKLARPIKRED